MASDPLSSGQSDLCIKDPTRQIIDFMLSLDALDVNWQDIASTVLDKISIWDIVLVKAKMEPASKSLREKIKLIIEDLINKMGNVIDTPLEPQKVTKYPVIIQPSNTLDKSSKKNQNIIIEPKKHVIVVQPSPELMKQMALDRNSISQVSRRSKKASNPEPLINQETIDSNDDEQIEEVEVSSNEAKSHVHVNGNPVSREFELKDLAGLKDDIAKMRKSNSKNVSNIPIPKPSQKVFTNDKVINNDVIMEVVEENPAKPSTAKTKKVYKCDFPNCTLTFSKKSLIRHHMSEAHGAVNECDQCDYVTSTNKLEYHLFAHSYLVRCQKCKKHFPKPNIEFHSAVCDANGKCPKCDFETEKIDNLERHFYEIHILKKVEAEKSSNDQKRKLPGNVNESRLVEVPKKSKTEPFSPEIKKPKMEPSLPTSTYLKKNVFQNRNSENKTSEDKNSIMKSEIKNENVSLTSMAIGKTPLPSMPPIRFEVEDEFL